MSLLIPAIDNEQRDKRLVLLKGNIIYPISTQWSKVVNAANYATADASTLGFYTTNTIRLPFNFGIVGMRLSNVLQSADTITPNMVFALSLASVFTVADTMGIATQPDDSGNILYRTCQTNIDLNETFWLKNGPNHDNFFIPANTTLYVHQWCTTALRTAASVTAQGFFTLYVEHTGIRT